MRRIIKLSLIVIVNVFLAMMWSIGLMVALVVIGLDAARIYLFKKF